MWRVNMSVAICRDHPDSHSEWMDAEYLDINYLTNETLGQFSPLGDRNIVYINTSYHGISIRSLETVLELNSAIFECGIAHSEPGPP